MDEFNFLLIVLAPDRAAYAGFIDQLWENGCFEDLSIDFKSNDPEVQAFLRERFGWNGEGEPPPLKELIEGLAERFPPPFGHRDMLCKEGTRYLLAGDNIPALIERDAEWREIDRIKIVMTMRSPELMNVDGVPLADYIENQYKPMMRGLVGHEDFWPDDFETTLNLLGGEPDIIRKEDRTFELELPCRDVTNSVWLLDRSLKHQFAFNDLVLGKCPDPHALALDLGAPPYFHLFCFAMGVAVTFAENMAFTVVPYGE